MFDPRFRAAPLGLSFCCVHSLSRAALRSALGYLSAAPLGLLFLPFPHPTGRGILTLIQSISGIQTMSTVRFTAEVLPDGTIRPPQEIRLTPGKAEVTVDTPVEPAADTPGDVPERRSLADWADKEAEHWGERLRADDVSSFTGRSD